MRSYTARVTAVLTVVAVTLGLLALTACRNPDAPHDIRVTCQPQVIDTPQGSWVTGDSVCTWLDLTTGQGGPGRGPQG